jgi:twitching motility protein PilT
VKLLDSLLDAIVRLEGDALVMHVGEKPYVVTASSSMNAYRGPLAWGQVELSSRVLTFDAVSSMLGQILPADQQQALTEFGAIEHEIPSPAGVADRFTVVAARGGEDVWVELRRRPVEIPHAAVPADAPQAPAEAPTEQPPAAPTSGAAAVSAGVIVKEAPPVAQAPSIAAPAAETAAEPAVPAPEPAPAVPVEREHVEPATESREEQTVQEIELATESAQAHEQPAGEVELQQSESIVVAIPGQAAEEFALNGVPDNAIQIVDEEPQGVPTEEEVDAMLAATATALLTSGLAGEVVTDEDTIAPGTESVDDEAMRDAEPIEDETEIILTETLTVAVVMSEVVSGVEAESPAGEPAWELSPPPPDYIPDEPPAEQVEAAGEPPVGTPLFSDEAVLAAAPAPSAPVEPEPAVQTAPSFEMMQGAAQVPAGVLPVAEYPPAAEMSTVPEFAPAVEPAPTAESPAVAESPLLEQTVPIAEKPPVEEPPRDEPPTEAPPAEEPPVQEPPVEEPPAKEPPVEEPPAEELLVKEPAAPGRTLIEPAIVERAPIAAAPELPTAVGDSPLGEPASIVATMSTAPVAEAPSLEPAAEEQTPPEPVSADTSSRETVVTLPTAAEAPVPAPVNIVNAGAEPAVPEPASGQWETSAPEMPMDVTPELRGQDELVAEVARWASASPEAPAQELPQRALPEEAYAQADDEARQAVVVPLARTQARSESISVPFTPSEDARLMHTLRAAAARGATTVYVVAQSKPMIRVDGEIGPLENEPTLTAADVDRLVLELAPPRRRDALQNGPVEWLCDVPQIGRVRCLTFRDHRGPGVLFRMFPPRAISADQLGLTPEVQALCQQSDGLVLVSGARASGKSTLLNAFVDLINRTRSDHVITIETQIGFVHESRRSFISQRESRGDVELAATFARAALHEDPDVMVIEDLKSADLISVALEAAESGRLVLASVPASSTIGALERLIEVFPADRRAKARASLATALRGVLAQVLLRRVTGGLVAAREILLNTPAVSQLVLEGKLFQLPAALDSGRRHGMVPLTDSLAAHVREGTVQVAEAYRKALDRAALVALLKREGIDTSFADRLA